MRGDWLKDAKYEDMEKEARELASNAREASNQAMRAILTTILEMGKKPEKLPLAIPKLYLHAERNDRRARRETEKIKPLIKEIEPLLREGKEMEKLKEFMEAIVTYHYSQPWKEERKNRR